MFKKIITSDEKITIKPTYVYSTFLRLLHLLTDEDILLTFKERDELYKHINFLVNFLEDKKYGKNN